MRCQYVALEKIIMLQLKKKVEKKEHAIHWHHFATFLVDRNPSSCVEAPFWCMVVRPFWPPRNPSSWMGSFVWCLWGEVGGGGGDVLGGWEPWGVGHPCSPWAEGGQVGYALGTQIAQMTKGPVISTGWVDWGALVFWGGFGCCVVDGFWFVCGCVGWGLGCRGWVVMISPQVRTAVCTWYMHKHINVYTTWQEYCACMACTITSIVAVLRVDPPLGCRGDPSQL